jgi:hypothetical protein
MRTVGWSTCVTNRNKSDSKRDEEIPHISNRNRTNMKRNVKSNIMVTVGAVWWWQVGVYVSDARCWIVIHFSLKRNENVHCWRFVHPCNEHEGDLAENGPSLCTYRSHYYCHMLAYGSYHFNSMLQINVLFISAGRNLTLAWAFSLYH